MIACSPIISTTSSRRLKHLCSNCNLHLDSCLNIDNNLLYYFRWSIQTASHISISTLSLTDASTFSSRHFSNIQDYLSEIVRQVKAKLTQSTVCVSSSHMYPMSYYLHRKVSSSSSPSSSWLANARGP